MKKSVLLCDCHDDTVVIAVDRIIIRSVMGGKILTDVCMPCRERIMGALKNVVANGGGPEFECTKCPRKFTSKQGRSRHLHETHKVKKAA